MAWLDRYMAVPFLHGGRSFAGADCAGLYALIVSHEAGQAISFPEGLAAQFDPKAAAETIALAIATGQWRKIAGAPKAVARKFDAILMSGFVPDGKGGVIRADVHLGCATGDGKLIHTEAGTGPRYLPLDDPDIQRRLRQPDVHGVYRPAFLDADQP